MALAEKTRSDTVSVTPDGRIVVDTARLFKKEHVQEMIQKMRSKTTAVQKRPQPKKATV